MVGVDATLRTKLRGGKRPDAVGRHRPGAAAAVAVAALLAFSACATSGSRTPEQSRAAQRVVMEHVDAGLNLYESGDFVLAARRFESAGAGAKRCGDLSMERRAVTGACTSWLRARRLGELAECTARLEALQRRERRSDPGLNTLLAIGAIAGGRPLPPFKVPNAVHPIVRGSAMESM